jgi:formiminoglutamase
MGGGHETAWGHFQGISPNCKNLLIINFDAHYDMRPLIDGQWGSSGTPFTQIAEFCKKENNSFDYMCIGIQERSNTESICKRAEQWNVKTISAETIHSKGLASTLSLLDETIASYDGVYLSVCMDVFAQTYAPGVSAPQALGLKPWQVIPLIRKIVASKKVISADFVELCPPFDQDNQTARLVASLILEFCIIGSQ